MRLRELDRGEPLAHTHISQLVALDDRVYKRKVAAAFGFVDQRSLEARRRLCEAEVALNRRLAPDVYLGVEPLTDDDGAIVDHAVVMRRMPPDRSLAALLARGADVGACVRALARLVAAFHARADRSDAITAAGSRHAVSTLWTDSLNDLDTFDGSLVDHELLASLRARSTAYLAGRAPLFAERARRGLIVDGHGDLLAPDVYCLADGPRVLDCLEFDERFRYGDVLLDIAFLVMDLRWRGRPDLADACMATYGELSAEHHPASLLAHFVAYRAVVRAKVTAYRARNGDTAAVAEAAGLLGLANEQLRAATVRLVLVGGLPGTGKTTLAEALSGAAGWATVNTDAVRRELTGGPSPDAWGRGAYAPETTDRVYAVVLGRTADALARGESVIVDASFADPARRDAARAVAAAASAACVELRCVTPPEVAERRIVARGTSGASDATAAIAARMAATYAPWPEATVIDTATSLDDARCAANAAAVAV